jgi:hypothetical protein
VATYTVEIGDDEGKSFKISVSITTTFSGRSTGSWRTLDKGFIRYNSGTAYNQVPDSGGGPTDRDVILVATDDEHWGIKLGLFHDWVGANDQGSGQIVQPWVLSIKAGTISWVLV